MTDVYIDSLRRRNAARAQASAQQLGSRWLLHPDNNVTCDEYREFRRGRAERIDLRVIIVPNATRDAFQRHAQQVFESGLLIDPEKDKSATRVLERTGLRGIPHDPDAQGGDQ
jgi:hypothetical protein